MSWQEAIEQAFAEQQRDEFYRAKNFHPPEVVLPPPPFDEGEVAVVEAPVTPKIRTFCDLCGRSFSAVLLHHAKASLARHRNAHIRAMTKKHG